MQTALPLILATLISLMQAFVHTSIHHNFGKEISSFKNNVHNHNSKRCSKDFLSNPKEEGVIILEQDTNTSQDQSTIPILVLCWFVTFLAALDRVAMSITIQPLSTEYHLMDGVKGEISPFFSVGYGLAIIPCGVLLSVFSPRVIMTVGVGLWSFATLGTPIAASFIDFAATSFSTSGASIYTVENIAPLLGIRAVMGAAESVAIPTVQ